MTISKKILLSLSTAAVVVFALSSAAFAEAKTGVVTEDGVNFRQKPDLSSKVLDKLVKGTKVNVVGSEGEWFTVVYSDASGWIIDDYLVVRDEKIASGVVSGSVVNVRSKATTDSEILTKLEKGTKVDVYEHTGDWYRVSIGEGRYGWINSEFLTVREESVSRGEEDSETAAEVEEISEDAGEVPDEASENTDEALAEAEDKDADLADRGADSNGEGREDAVLRKQIVEYAKTLIGIKYRYGGTTTKGFDCSGFVKYVFNHFDISLERTSSDQSRGGETVKKADLQPGDLVFFDTSGGLNNVTHVGIYIGDGKFIHASTYKKHAITIESLSSAYYSKRYMRARDYISK